MDEASVTKGPDGPSQGGGSGAGERSRRAHDDVDAIVLVVDEVQAVEGGTRPSAGTLRDEPIRDHDDLVERRARSLRIANPLGRQRTRGSNTRRLLDPEQEPHVDD